MSQLQSEGENAVLKKELLVHKNRLEEALQKVTDLERDVSVARNIAGRCTERLSDLMTQVEEHVTAESRWSKRYSMVKVCMDTVPTLCKHALTALRDTAPCAAPRSCRRTAG